MSISPIRFHGFGPKTERLLLYVLNTSENRLFRERISSPKTFAEDRLSGVHGFPTNNPFIPYGIVSRQLTPQKVIEERASIRDIGILVNQRILALDMKWNLGGALLEMSDGAKAELLDLLKHFDDSKKIPAVWRFTPFEVDKTTGYLKTDDTPHLKAVGDITIADDLSKDIKFKTFVTQWNPNVPTSPDFAVNLGIDKEGLIISRLM